ncbi:hypothetical protein HG530_007859 [Fusarium avenaceum]|nr:hypothetical protein HG530_007859 [Fusarium avenaceum]
MDGAASPAASAAAILAAGGAVIVDGVDTRTILPEEHHTAKEEAPLDVSALERTEWLPETSTDFSVVAVKLLVHVANFFDDPTRRLLDPEGAEKQHAGGNELNSEGDDPLLVARSHGLSKSIVDPEAHKATNLPAQFVDTDEATTDSRRRQLRAVDWNHIRTSADTNSSKNTATDNKSQSSVSIGAKHHAGTKHKDEAEGNQSITSTDVV